MLPALAGVTVLGGCGSSDAVSASAGPDQAVLINAVVTLDGNGSTGVSSVKWTFTSKPTGSSASITNDTSLSPTFTPDLVGDYVARLSVNNNAAVDTVTISASAAAVSVTVPTTSAITTRTRLGVSEYAVDASATGATLSAAGSTVAGLKLKNEAIVYSWEQVGGPKAVLDTDTINSETLSFTAPSIGVLQNARSLYTNESTGLQQISENSYKWQVLPISRNDTKMTFRLTINGEESRDFDVYLQDDGKEIHPQTGLSNVGIGSKVYLSGATYVSAPSTSYITGTRTANSNGTQYTTWRWDLTKPSGSTATFDDSGTASSTVQFPTFTPDVAGVYTVAYCSGVNSDITVCRPRNTAGTASSSNSLAYFYSDPYASRGSNVVAPGVYIPGVITINAGNYVGEGTIGGATAEGAQCATCHGENDRSGRGYGNVVAKWEETLHSHIFADKMDSGAYNSLLPEPYLWPINTTGFNKDAVNGGFDDLAADYNFSLSSGLTYTDFVTHNPEVAKLANVQCESCHGPGSEHSGDPVRIGMSASQPGVCGQCHIEADQWKLSLHSSVSTSGWGNWLTNPSCIKCHSNEGFQVFMEGDGEGGGVDHIRAATDAVIAQVDVKDKRQVLERFPAKPVMILMMPPIAIS
ncbi:MAG: hypothetical protein IPJ69_04160 [Deltaproteobacteria bacterium]|nr:MAG: hypothetical protein IPJ69_04160 [Deltaproteobacteria bacterium]